MTEAGAENLYIAGLPDTMTEESTKAIFAQYGVVVSVKMLPKRKGKDDIAAMVKMGEADQAKWLIDNVNGQIPQGLAAPVEVKPAVRGLGWKGKGKGKGFMGLPPVPYPVMMMMMKGKGKGKGMFPMMNMMMGKGKGKGGGLNDFTADKKVWVGDLPDTVTYEQLMTHFSSIGKAKFATVMKGKGAGTGGVAFETAAEATSAVKMLNGSSLGGKTIQVDVWEKKKK